MCDRIKNSGFITILQPSVIVKEFSQQDAPGKVTERVMLQLFDSHSPMTQFLWAILYTYI